MKKSIKPTEGVSSVSRKRGSMEAIKRLYGNGNNRNQINKYPIALMKYIDAEMNGISDNLALLAGIGEIFDDLMKMKMSREVSINQKYENKVK
jgi:hypothetical protein